MRRKLRSVLKVSWPHVYRETMAWMRASAPGSLLFAPVVFPVIFALKLYEQYLIWSVIDGLGEAVALLNKVLASKHTR